MAPAASQQLKALLAMPAGLRPVLLGASSLRTHSRLFSASSLRYAIPKYPNVAAFIIPEFRTSSIAEITPDDLFKTSSLLSAPGQPLEEELTKLFIKNPAAFTNAESDFYKLKRNTRTPEVCILGRSNVGKSSFVNALANRQSNSLAFVSKRAGRTRSINHYGFGPAPTIKELQAQAAEYKGKEDIPTHAFHLVDMPGYGHASLKEWGKNITLYLSKRDSVKGAIVLIDAEVGPKDSDFHLLELLSTAQLKTAIVLTKADKVKKGLVGLHETCTKLWDGLRAIEASITEGKWTWEKDVYVTAVGARDSTVVRSTVTTARLAVARLAGLVKEKKPKIERDQRWSGKTISFDDLQYTPSKSNMSAASKDTGKFTEPIQEAPSPKNIGALSKPKSTEAFPKVNSAFADSAGVTKPEHSNGLRLATSYMAQSQTRARRTVVRPKNSSSNTGGSYKPRNTEGLDKANNAFADLEWATNPQHSSQGRVDTGFGPQSWPKTGRTHARAKNPSISRNTEGLSKPRNTGAFSKPRNAAAFSKPRNTKAFSKPRNTEDFSEPRNMGGFSKANNAFAELERATKSQHSSRPRLDSGFGSQSWARAGRAHARAFHSTSVRSGELPRDQPTAAELKGILDDFVRSLRTDTPRDRLRRLQEERERRPQKISRTSLQQIEDRQIKRLQQRYPELATRTRAVYDRRLKIEDNQRRDMAARAAEAKTAPKVDWPANDDSKTEESINEALDESTFYDAFETSAGYMVGHKSKKEKKKEKNAKKAAKEAEELDPFMAKFGERR